MERRYLEAEALRQASTVVTAGINPRESIGRILAQSTGVVSADAVFVWAVTENGLGVRRGPGRRLPASHTAGSHAPHLLLGAP
ncbi:MAG: hypothetical protein MZW92_16860 [Comamonadaceae bacterium]|nr:hypothetical protein [Comamonadaceae bacterium]